MTLHPLTAIAPVDGRYRAQAEPLAAYFSEYALMRYRLLVEVEYFIALCEIPLPQLAGIDKASCEALRALYEPFPLASAEEIKRIERITNHDVKAVEYFLKARFDELGLQPFREFIHFGLTSQDINNTAVPCSFRDALQAAYYPLLDNLQEQLQALAGEWDDVPMLARTHGQPASPTRVGKEIRVFTERLAKQRALLEAIPFAAKFGGATGNFNAHHAAYPSIDWRTFADAFVGRSLQLARSQCTTQIEHYDYLAAQFDALKRINTVLLDLARDMWLYISMDYFKQKIKDGEVGSSAMPHKVNPIDFENAEGNIGVANALYEHLSAKLPVSRLQRDLTDSTVLRNIGVPLAHSLLAIQSLRKGLDKLYINRAAITTDLDRNWAVVAEGIQTILRRERYPNPYEALKALTRTNETITQESITQFIRSLDVPDDIKNELLQLTPQSYTGVMVNG
ncbi:MAG: adenylosuccinate lyase [Prevotellaceae bacterium]|jgi:adenylosuccinate lyase|nr:adenylosuccinate lyase [Prevotellaceae bacterium]